MRRTPRPIAFWAALATVGLPSTVGQLVLLRELIAVFYGNELVLGLILAVWLACVATGAWGLARRSAGLGAGAMAAGLAASALILPAQAALIRGGRSLLGVTPGRLVAVGPMALAKRRARCHLAPPQPTCDAERRAGYHPAPQPP